MFYQAFSLCVCVCVCVCVSTDYLNNDEVSKYPRLRTGFKVMEICSNANFAQKWIIK
jgi:hypothetical protein